MTRWRGKDVPLTVTSSGRAAIALALAALPAASEVWITSSLGTHPRRMSACVSEAVSRAARPVAEPTAQTRGIVVVHEWGIPHPTLGTIRQEAERKGWLVVHDCAHALKHGLDLAQSGAIVAFSLPKFFPIAHGGLLAGPRGCLEDLKQPTTLPDDRDFLRLMLLTVDHRCQQHVENWRRLDAIASHYRLQGEDNVAPDVVPQAYRLRFQRQFAAQQIMETHGIETTPPFYAGWLALPCHSKLPDSYWNEVTMAIERISHLARAT